MIDRRRARRVLFYILAMLMAASGLPLAAQQIQRENNDLRITSIDTPAFPSVAVRILTTTTGSAPIPDLTRLILRENGVPIPETTAAQTPVGIDLVMVVDANPDLLLFDDSSGLSRRDKLVAGIIRYTELFMDPAGLDRVSIVVPDEAGEGAAFLVQDATRPDDVAAAASAYTPVPPRVTPLQSMLATAIDHLAASEAGRFQAVLLYTDGARLNRQLDYPALTEAAQSAGIPLYVAILGTQASEDEIANVTGLYSPTNGLYVPMPEPEAADPVYTIFQAQGRQTQLTYRSELRQNGRHEVSVSLGNVRDAAEFDLALAGPKVVIDPPPSPVRRAGSAVDTPLALLQPAVLPLTVRVSWPDDRPRGLTEIVFLVDGTPQPLSGGLAPDGAGQLPLPWDISGRDAGTYRLEVQVVDDLGFRAAAEPVPVTIEIARPSPPTPTPAPTAIPLPSLGERLGGSSLLPLLLLAGLAGVVVFFWLRRSRRVAPAAETDVPRIIPAAEPPAGDHHVAVLEGWAAGGATGEQIELTLSDVTFGREAEEVDIVIDDPSISRLHARIRRTAAGEYWLYDEGSLSGTFLNYEQLRLAPRQLQHDDMIQIGRVTLRFRLELPRPRANEHRTTTGGDDSP